MKIKRKWLLENIESMEMSIYERMDGAVMDLSYRDLAYWKGWHACLGWMRGVIEAHRKLDDALSRVHELDKGEVGKDED